MEVEQNTWELVGILAAATVAGGSWLYARIYGAYNRLDNRLDKVTNHMTEEDNKLHMRVDTVVERIAHIAVLDSRMEHFGKIQDETLKEVKELNQSMRHRVGNMEQVAVRADERLKQLEKTSR